MKNLEKLLAELPKPKLGFMADLKLEFGLYRLIFIKKTGQFFHGTTHRTFVFRTGVVITLTVVIVTSSASIYAYSSSSVAPGDKLYPLKRLVENTEEKLSIGDYAKAKTLQKLSDRRLEEALNLSSATLADNQSSQAQNEKEKVSQNIQQSITDAVKNIGSAVDAVQNIKDDKQSEKAKSMLREKESVGENYLNQIENNVNLKQDKVLEEKVGQAKRAMSQYRGMLRENKNQNGQNEAGVGDQAVASSTNEFGEGNQAVASSTPDQAGQVKIKQSDQKWSQDATEKFQNKKKPESGRNSGKKAHSN